MLAELEKVATPDEAERITKFRKNSDFIKSVSEQAMEPVHLYTDGHAAELSVTRCEEICRTIEAELLQIEQAAESRVAEGAARLRAIDSIAATVEEQSAISSEIARSVEVISAPRRS